MAQISLNILDFSGAFAQEGLPLIDCNVIGCQDIEGTNCYCEDEAQEEILGRFRKGRKVSGIQVNWIDTGDYHHLSKMTISESVIENGPMTVIQIDHHPDMQEPAFGGILSCGGWLRNLLEECPDVEKAFVLGINPELAGECEGFGERVTVFDEEAVMQDSEGKSLGIIDRICEAVKGRKVFFSIDKDVLGREWSRTDWDHGTMTLDFLCSTVRKVSNVSEIVGIDLCGGITVGKGGSGEDFAINKRTDLALLELAKMIN